MILFIDLGNSRLKWALHDGHLRTGVPIDHAQQFPSQLEMLWRDIGEVERALVASVAAPTRETELAVAIATRFGIDAEFMRTPAQAAGVHNAYAIPSKLGIDRFLALVALHAEGVAPVIHAGVGTALTLDALGADGIHRGGLIAPSPTLMQHALLGATTRLTVADEAIVAELATSTESAVRSGCLLAAVALIERFRAQASSAFDAEPKLVLSGGGAEPLAPLIAPPVRIAEDLVLRGLAAMVLANG